MQVIVSSLTARCRQLSTRNVNNQHNAAIVKYAHFPVQYVCSVCVYNDTQMGAVSKSSAFNSFTMNPEININKKTKGL